MLKVAEARPQPAPRDRPATLAHRLEYGLIRALFFLFRIVGVDAASTVAGAFARTVGPLLPVANRAHANLKLVYPDMSADERRRIVKGVFENLGRTAAEMAHVEKFEPQSGRVDVVIPKNLTKATPGALPGIFVSGHFANWEIMAAALHQAGVDAAVIYRALNNPLLDAFIIGTRAPVMGQLIPKGKHGNRTLIDALREGRSLAMLADQKLNSGIAVPFMGVEAMTAPAAARLSLKYGVPVYSGRIERLEGAHFRVTLDPAIPYAPEGDFAEDVRNLTILINQRLEGYIRARPEQWLWLHRRWKRL